MLDNEHLVGNESRVRNLALDSRVYAGDFEFGVMYYRMDQGYGVEYAGNALQANSVWVEQERNIFLKHRKSMESAYLKDFQITNLFRYRNSDVVGHSMEFYNYGGYVGFDTFQSMNDSVFFQSSDFSLSDDLSMVMDYRMSLRTYKETLMSCLVIILLRLMQILLIRIQFQILLILKKSMRKDFMEDKSLFYYRSITYPQYWV